MNLFPFCRVGNLHRSLSDMQQLLDLYLIRRRSEAPHLISEIVDSKKFLETHTLAKIFFTYISMKEIFKVDIPVTLYERYDRNCVCLRHKFHRIEERTRAASSFRPVSKSANSFRFFVDKCVVCLVIDTTLSFRGNR